MTSASNDVLMGKNRGGGILGNDEVKFCDTGNRWLTRFKQFYCTQKPIQFLSPILNQGLSRCFIYHIFWFGKSFFNFAKDDYDAIYNF